MEFDKNQFHKFGEGAPGWKMASVPRRTRRRLVLLTVVSFIISSILYFALPLDSPLRLAVSFNAARVANSVRQTAWDRDAWLHAPPLSSIDLSTEVGYLIKTGYGTRHRIPLQLEAFRRSGGMLGKEGDNFIVVGDWTTVNETDAKIIGVPVHDALKVVWDKDSLRRNGQHLRFRKYKSLQAAIKTGDESKAQEIGKRFGWELDALKFTAGMELLYHRMPHKKWYIILDDDTYLAKNTLELMLTHLNPELPHYIGNAVGDYRGRFAHGGSGIVVSSEAMRKLFSQPSVVAQSYRDSLDETWGDKLVATTLQKVGVYLDERYSHHFSGEAPELARVSADRFCSPILSFHTLRTPSAMADISRVVRASKQPLVWGDLLDRFGTETSNPDHVGPITEHARMWTNVQDAAKCRSKCEASKSSICLAWRFDANKKQCYTSPWVVPGAEGETTQVSGFNKEVVEHLRERCGLGGVVVEW